MWEVEILRKRGRIRDERRHGRRGEEIKKKENREEKKNRIIRDGSFEIWKEIRR